MDKNGPVFSCPHCGSRHTELSRASLPFLPEWLRHLLPVSGTCPHLQGLREKVRHVYHVGGGPLPWRPCFLLM